MSAMSDATYYYYYRPAILLLLCHYCWYYYAILFIIETRLLYYIIMIFPIYEWHIRSYEEHIIIWSIHIYYLILLYEKIWFILSPFMSHIHIIYIIHHSYIHIAIIPIHGLLCHYAIHIIAPFIPSYMSILSNYYYMSTYYTHLIHIVTYIICYCLVCHTSIMLCLLYYYYAHLTILLLLFMLMILFSYCSIYMQELLYTLTSLDTLLYMLLTYYYIYIIITYYIITYYIIILRYIIIT